MDITNRFRKLHLDFHNSPALREVGADFNADEFGAALALARVNHVVCSAKCHHGMCYYPAATGTRHPALAFDLLGAQVQACHQRDIAVSAYFSVAWDEEAARLHPEWRPLGPDGAPRHKIAGEGWATVCLNSPYVEEMLIPQVAEVLGKYDVDGVWFDMIRLDENACHCAWCQAKMVRMGLSYDDPAERWRYVEGSIYGFLKRMTNAVRRLRAGIAIAYNSQARLGARRAASHVTSFEIECAPAEGGALSFNLFGRHVRTLGRCTCGVSPSFFRCGADCGGLKNPAQLRWETARMLANGSQCALGDRMHPRGRLVPAVYERIGQVYGAVTEREPWCVDAVPVTEIAVLVDDPREEFGIAQASDAAWGVTRLLMETQCQFDLIDAQGPLDKYRLLILPDNRDIDGALAARIRAFIQHGGALFAEGCAAYSATTGGFILPEDPASYRHVPWGMASPYPALVQCGHVIYSVAPLSAAYHRAADTSNRLIFARCLDELLPRRLVRVDGLPTLEASLLRQGDRFILHLVHFAAHGRGAAPEVIEGIPPLANIPVQVRCAARPKRVYLAPSRQELEFGFRDGYVRVVVPIIDIHQMVVVE